MKTVGITELERAHSGRCVAARSAAVTYDGTNRKELRMRKAAPISVVLLLVAGFSSAQTASKAAGPAAADEIRQRWMAAGNAKDAAGIAALNAEDAIVMPPNAAAVKGRAAIQSFWKGMVDELGSNVTLTRVGGWQGGYTGYETGTYAAMMGTVNDRGKYLITFKKGTDGKWFITNDIFNSDLPCPPPAPAK